MSAPWQRCSLLPEPAELLRQQLPAQSHQQGTLQGHILLGVSWWPRRCWQGLAHLSLHHPCSGLQLQQPQKPSCKGGTTGLL